MFTWLPILTFRLRVLSQRKTHTSPSSVILVFAIKMDTLRHLHYVQIVQLTVKNFGLLYKVLWRLDIKQNLYKEFTRHEIYSVIKDSYRQRTRKQKYKKRTLVSNNHYI